MATRVNKRTTEDCAKLGCKFFSGLGVMSEWLFDHHTIPTTTRLIQGATGLCMCKQNKVMKTQNEKKKKKTNGNGESKNIYIK
jgi:hypothetical protein